MPFMKKLFRSKKSAKRLIHGSTPSTEDVNVASTGNLGKVFKELDCPVCFNTCIPPIHSCINGHIICNTCRENVFQCPSCRHGFSGTRNFFAENFITNCSQSCRYSDGMRVSAGYEGLLANIYFFETAFDPFYCGWSKTESILRPNLTWANMQPHESQCIFRPITCLIPNCGQEIPYKSLLSHLTFNHKICGSDLLPASITFHADQPIINNRKWLPFAIQAFGNVFYVMMEVIRPHFWVWIWLQTAKMEDSFESLFITQITVKNTDKKLKLMWEGPVQSVRTSDKVIMRDGLCFVAHEVFLQHFNSNGYFTFHVDIKKAPRTTATDLNANIVSTRTMTIPNLNIRSQLNSDRSLYNNAILREQEELMDCPPGTLVDPTDSFVSKLSN